MNKQSEVIILHISDLHRTPNAEMTNANLWGNLKHDILNGFARTNRTLRGDEPQLPDPAEIDVVLVSGDLTQRATEEEYAQAKEFLDMIVHDVLDNDKQRVVIVPGNHDVDWSFSRGAYERVSNPTREDIKAAVRHESCFRLEKSDDPLKLNLQKREREDFYQRRFEEFAKFFSLFYEDSYRFPLTDRTSQFTIFDGFIGKLGVVIVGFSSCDLVDHLWHTGAIHPEAILNASAKLDRHGYTAEKTTRIAVWHHNVLGNPQRSDFMDPVTAISLAQHGFSLGLHGHVHETGRLDLLGSYANLPIVWAGSLCAGSSERPPSIPLLYNVIGLHPTNRRAWVHVRARKHERDAWSPYHDWGEKRSCWYPISLPYPGISSRALGDREKQIEVLEEQNNSLKTALNNSYEAISRVIHRLYPLGKPNPAKHYLEKLYCRYLIDAEGNASVKEECTVVSDGEPVHYWVRTIIADEDALEAPFFEELNLQVLDLDHNTDTPFLVFENGRRHKKFCIVFLPPISLGEKRNIRMCFSWPGYNRHLLNGQTAPYDWGRYIVSRDVECALDVGVGFHPHLGYIACKDFSPPSDTATLDELTDEDGWLFWVYKSTTARLGNVKYRLVFRKA